MVSSIVIFIYDREKKYADLQKEGQNDMEMYK